MSDEISGDFGFAAAFSRYRTYLSDVCDVDYTCGKEAGKGFGTRTAVFNDNVTIRVLTQPEMQKVDIAYLRTGVEDVLGEKVGIHRVDNGRSSHLRFCLSFVAKTSIEDALADVGALIGKYKRIQLCDIDFTVDCERITTRETLLNWLPSGTKISDRKNNTGKNCLSWFEDNGRIRCKVYNKIVQILESAGVREPIGSSIHTLLTDTDIASTAIDYQLFGVTRIEVTFYSSELQTPRYYTETVLGLYKRLESCPTFSVSLEDQWKALRDQLTQMLCIYDEKTSAFAYCQWWNSLTGKIQGASKTVKPKDLMKIVGNYSFPNRPIYLIQVSKTTGDEKIRVFRRNSSDDDDKNLTLVPGPNGGLYPNGKKKCHNLAEYGMGSLDPGYIGWGDTRLRPTDAAIGLVGEILQESTLVDEIDALVNKMSKITINTKEYTPAYKTLEMDKEYTFSAFGQEVFHGKECIFARTTCGKAIRCEKSLATLITSHGDAAGPLKIRTIKVVKPKNVPDLQCSVIPNDNAQ